VRLEQEMTTGKDKVNKTFEVKTIEPLQTSSGHVIPPGARIVGHVSRIEPAGLTGRARLWLTFDDIDTRRGTLPIVAEVSSVPGEFSGRARAKKEKLRRAPARERKWSKRRPEARQWVQPQGLRLIMAKPPQSGPQRAALPLFWRPLDSARNSIFLRGRSSNWCLIGRCI
jgi:hypothetical protein